METLTETTRPRNHEQVSTRPRTAWRDALLAKLPFLPVLRDLWPFIRPSRQRLISAGVVSVFLTFSEITAPVMIGLFVDGILHGVRGKSPGASAGTSQGLLLVGIGIAALLRGYLVSQQRWIAGRIGELVAARMRNALWEHLSWLPLEYTRRRGPGQLLLRFTGDARAVQRIVTHGIVQLSQDLLLGLGVLVALCFLNLRMAAAILAILPAYLWIFKWLNPQLQHESRAARRRRSRLSSYLHERLVGMGTVKAFANQKLEAENVEELNRGIAARAGRRARVEGRLMGWTTGLLALGTLMVLMIASSEAAAGRLQAGTLVAFLTLLGLLVPVFRRIAAVNRYYQEGEISLHRLMATLRAEPETREKKPRLKVTDGHLVVRNLAFRLGTDGPPIMSDVSFAARPGHIAAVLGPNGSGKSTLVELLLRFQEPTKGEILVDGENIADVSLRSLRKQFGWMPNDAVLFDGTIRENIGYGLGKDVPLEKIERAARLAGVDQFVGELEKQWETSVGRGGQNLSSGQRRQIALARTLAMDPPILVLDEPFSGLDPKAEALLISVIRKLAEEKTVVLVAHRMPFGLQAGSICNLPARMVQTERRSTESFVPLEDDED